MSLTANLEDILSQRYCRIDETGYKIKKELQTFVHIKINLPIAGYRCRRRR
jgi:hypothetical protein